MPLQTVLITGCSAGGIGSALAEDFLRRGFHVFATARDMAKMAHFQGQQNVTLLKLDTTDAGDIEAAVKVVQKHTAGTSGLDYLVNNAGRNFFGPVLDLNIDDVKHIYETNLWGPIRLIQAFAPLLIRSKGNVVSITSISGYLNVPWMGLYAASKRSLEIVTETLRLELAPLGVKVVSVVTGAVKSQGQTYFGDFKLPRGSLYTSIEEVVAARAQGGDGVQRMDTAEYATAVINDLLNGATGKIWYGTNAESTQKGQALPASAMDDPLIKGTGLDTMAMMRHSGGSSDLFASGTG